MFAKGKKIISGMCFVLKAIVTNLSARRPAAARPSCRPTSGDDVEDAGSGHAADVVGGPAEDGAVVHLGARPVAERAARLAAVHQPAVQLAPLGRVVERPQEARLRRVGRHVTEHVGRLPLADAVDVLQARLAGGRG